MLINRNGEASRRKQIWPALSAKVFVARCRLTIPALLMILIGHSWLSIDTIRQSSVTVDEFAHVPSGYLTLISGETGLYRKNPPLVKALLALPWLVDKPKIPTFQRDRIRDSWYPWIYATQLMMKNRDGYRSLFTHARLVNLALSLVVAIILFLWGKRLSGNRGGLITAFLYAFSPTILGYASIATIDIGPSLFLLLPLFFLSHSDESPQPIERASFPIILGGLLGLAWLTKWTGIIWSLAVLACYGYSRYQRNIPLRSLAWRMTQAVLMLLLVVNLAYRFQGTFNPIGSTHWVSGLGQTVDRILPDAIPIPLPGDFVAGLDEEHLAAEHGEFPSFLMGHWKLGGHPFYLPAVLLFKLPLSFWTALILSLIWRRHQPGHRDQQLIWIPSLMMIVSFMLFTNADVGLRYLLPAFVLVMIWTGAVLGRVVLIGSRQSRAVVLILVAAYGINTLHTHPNHLAFFNLLAGGPTNGHRVLLNANLDIGQDLPRLKQWLERNPGDPPYLAYFGHVDPTLYGIDYQHLPDHPVSGRVIASVNYVFGAPYVILEGDRLVEKPLHHFSWLAAFSPITRIGNTLWIYEIPNPSPQLRGEIEP